MENKKYDHQRPLAPPSRPSFERPPGSTNPGRQELKRHAGRLSGLFELREKGPRAVKSLVLNVSESGE